MRRSKLGEYVPADPRLIDEALERKGAKRVADLGEGDAGGDMDEDKEIFQKTVFEQLAKEFKLTFQEKGRKNQTYQFLIRMS